MASDLGRIETGDKTEGQEPSVVGLEVCQGTLEIDQADDVAWIAASVLFRRVGDVDDGPPSLRSHDLASFVGRDGDQPGTNLFGVAQRVESTPGDRPGALYGVVGRFGIATDDERDAGHRGAMLRDEPREGCFVTLCGEADSCDQNRRVLHGDIRHVR